jgi:hypothetical protein
MLLLTSLYEEDPFDGQQMTLWIIKTMTYDFLSLERYLQ